MPRNALSHKRLLFTSVGLLNRGQLRRYANELNKELGLIWIACLCRNSLSLGKGPKRPRGVGEVRVWGGGEIPKRGKTNTCGGWRMGVIWVGEGWR